LAQNEESGPDFTTAELALYVVNAGGNDFTKFTLSSLDAPILTSGIYFVFVRNKNIIFKQKILLMK